MWMVPYIQKGAHLKSLLASKHMHVERLRACNLGLKPSHQSRWLVEGRGQLLVALHESQNFILRHANRAKG